MMTSIHESLVTPGTEIIDRYPGDDPLLALDYRIALQVILSHKIALLEEAMTTDVPGLDTPIRQLAQETASWHSGEHQGMDLLSEFVDSMMSLADEDEADK
jgi:hypothetical protein